MNKEDYVIEDCNLVFISDKKLQKKREKQIADGREIAANKLNEGVMGYYLDLCFFVEKTGSSEMGREAYLDYHSLDYETFSKKWNLGNIWDKYKIVL